MGLLDGALDTLKSKSRGQSGNGVTTAPSTPPALVIVLSTSIVDQNDDFVTIDGVVNPGIIARGGITGFDRDTEWDVKKGKGTKGGTTTLSQLPPAKGSIKFLLWTDAHVAQWRTFRKTFKYDPTNKTKNAVDIFHPWLAELDITSVVTEKIGPRTFVSPGLYSITVDLLEYLPAPKTTITSTPNGSTSKGSGNASGKSDDPIADEQQRQIAALLKQANP